MLLGDTETQYWKHLRVHVNVYFRSLTTGYNHKRVRRTVQHVTLAFDVIKDMETQYWKHLRVYEYLF